MDGIESTADQYHLILVFKLPNIFHPYALCNVQKCSALFCDARIAEIHFDMTPVSVVSLKFYIAIKNR